ncbi:MAG: PAS domain-containing protein [Saprospiraceae bacterium]|nr:PAS domain-containing protein [Saprospiraceae bacterium]
MKAELLQREKLLQLVLDNIPSYVFWKDRHSVYMGCNQNFATSAGFESPTDIIGKTDFDMPWSKEESLFFRKVDKAVMDSGQAQINFEEPQTIKDGSMRWLRTSKIPLFDAAGKVIGILGAYEDITERKLMELQLIERNKMLEHVNRKLEIANVDLEQFAYATSHDLQEPLRMIGGFIGLFEMKYAKVLDEEGKEYLHFIKDGAARMSKLIRQILTYSKLEESEVQFQNTSIQDLLDEVFHDLQTLIVEKQVKIALTVPDFQIYCQPERIKMLFSNLIINGIKFNESRVPEVSLQLEDKNNEWIFTLSDNGIGIDAEFQDYIFKPFKRLNTRQKFPGSGVGLSICKRIINLHGGNIWISSNQPKGTSFHFTLPKELSTDTPTLETKTE